MISLHARSRSTRRTSLRATSSPARSISGDEETRSGLRLVDISDKPADFPARAFPTIHGRCLEPGTISPASRFRSCRRRTAPAAADDGPARTNGPQGSVRGRRDRRHRPARRKSPGPAIRRSNAWSLVKRPPGTSRPRGSAPPVLPSWDESRHRCDEQSSSLPPTGMNLARFMWDYVGIVRTSKRLERAAPHQGLRPARSTSTTPTLPSPTTLPSCATWS